MNEEKQGLMQRARNLQQRIEGRQQRFGKGKYGRVLMMARKPEPDEYEKTAKITGLGILVIGGLGFLIYILCDVFVPWLLTTLGY